LACAIFIAAGRPFPVGACRSSFIVFQPLQSGQRPSHRGDWWPQAWQEKLVFARIRKILKKLEV
jgi:hypothetical protein